MMACRKKGITVRSRCTSKNTRRQIEGAVFSSSSSEDEGDISSTGCRSCRSTSKEHFLRTHVGADQVTAGQEGARREVNSLSFKHFLKNGAQPNYQHTGARPKVYSSPVSSPNNVDKDTAVYSCNPTELPDFVQDHLVIEQCYLNHESNQPVISDMDNLPDFALNSMEQRQARLRIETKKDVSSVSCDIPFDLTGTLDKGVLHRNHSLPSNPARPAHSDRNRNIDSVKRPESPGFPLDLPLPPVNESPSVSNTPARVCSVADEPSVPKSLPDFLSDGLIHNRTALSLDSGTAPNISEDTERRLLGQIERYHQDLVAARRQITEKNMRIQILESELALAKEAEQEETVQGLANIPEDGGETPKNTRRDTSGETSVGSLKKKMKSLMTEISELREENQKLRAEMVTASRGGEYVSSNTDRTVRRLAGDLRTAASSAEISLRQLMSGVDNLRVLASALENVDRIEDRTKVIFVPDSDEDNAAGPAL